MTISNVALSHLSSSIIVQLARAAAAAASSDPATTETALTELSSERAATSKLLSLLRPNVVVSKSIPQNCHRSRESVPSIVPFAALAQLVT